MSDVKPLGSALAWAGQLRDLLHRQQSRIVFVESCTAGRIAATLSCLPGISQWMCGSFVVYRSASKTSWLGIPAAILDDPAVGPVSLEVSCRLAEAALQFTPEADYSIAVTGDVGPGASRETDGRIFCAFHSRTGASAQESLCLASSPPVDANDLGARFRRLEEASRRTLEFAVNVLRVRS